ncbi:hypothetical protein [Lactococcus termiticola]|uniref:Uncharacterized protein n=1 Tax=Lactococcus termiticola TaxID=2169526 RepID=A0A2R5HGQ0_9LACT|nr:hypothetical protein [Lactococcus termiticola]GBG96525.1 hypothetical protein NtB2_00638 [Lactococcus termiticola]
MAERRVSFPIIPDDSILEKDSRVIMTNEQLITRNPSEQVERPFYNEPKTTGLASNRGYNRTLDAKVSYKSQHRPLNADHSSASGFEKAPKKTSVDESRERIKRAASVPPKRPKAYVHPLDRDEDDFTSRRSTAAGKRPLGNIKNNPIQDMKQRGTVVHKDTKASEDYFKSKRESLFDRGL